MERRRVAHRIARGPDQRVSALDTAPDIEMDVRALAPIYNGFTKPINAQRVGTLTAHRAEALDALADIFSVRFSPYTPDDF